MDQNINIKSMKSMKSIKVKKKTQVFNKEVSLKCLYEILKDILNKVCMIDSSVQLDITEFVITKALFKRAEIHNLIKPFLETIKDHYYLSKQHYIDRQINYNNIIRQLCNVNDIKYVSTIVYSKSNYEIEYTIEMSLHMPIGDVGDLSGN